MKLELKENMYVRTKYGIQQIYEIDEHKTKWKYLYKLKKQDDDGCVDLGVLSEEDIIKASFNVIDLIEVGDYVNGYQVIEQSYTFQNIKFISIDTQDNWGWGKGEIPIKGIKSIVTKEQFEQMSYKLGE